MIIFLKFFIPYSLFFCFFPSFFFFFSLFFSAQQSQKETNTSFLFRQNDELDRMKNPISAFSFEMDIGAGKLLFPRKYSITNSTSGTLQNTI